MSNAQHNERIMAAADATKMMKSNSMEDRQRNPLSRISHSIFIYPIKLYQFFLSPWVGQHCRFYPSCSHYAIEAIQVHGVFHGGWLTLKRLFSCHPWCEGGVDLVPKIEEGKKL